MAKIAKSGCAKVPAHCYVCPPRPVCGDDGAWCVVQGFVPAGKYVSRADWVRGLFWERWFFGPTRISWDAHKRAVCTSATVGKCARTVAQQYLSMLDAKKVWDTLPIERCRDCGAEGYPRLPANHREMCDSSALDVYNCEHCGLVCYKTPGTIAKLCGSCGLLAGPEPEPERWGPPDDDGIPF